MGPTFSGLMTAALLLGQTPEAPYRGISQVYGQPYGTSAVAPGPNINSPDGMSAPAGRGWGWRGDRPILSRIQGWFGRRDATNTTTPGTYTPAGVTTIEPPISAPAGTISPAPVGEYPRKMPSTSSRAPATTEVIVQPVTGTPSSARPVPAVGSTAAPVTPQKQQASLPSPLLPSLANKVGRDEKFEWITGQLEIEHGTYVLYYATPDTVDPYQGRVVLQTSANMTQFRRGDLVSAHGQIGNRPGQRGSPVYRVTGIDLIERPQR